MKDIAKLAGVSKATVSHVINNTRFVSDEIKIKVYKIINELGYRRSEIARSLRVKKTKTIAFLNTDNSNSYFNEVSQGILSVCFKKGYSLIICDVEGIWEKEENYIDMLIKKGIDGIIGDFISEDEKIIEMFSRINVPIMPMNREIKGLKSDSILADDFQGGYLATKYLLSLGHVRIACVTAPIIKNHNTYKRLEGYKLALKEKNIDIDENLILKSYFKLQGGYDSLLSLMKIKNPPTAIFF